MHIWRLILLQSALGMILVTRGQAINSCLDPDNTGYLCTGTILGLSKCMLTDDDLDDLAICFDAAGREFIISIDLGDNLLEELPSDLFQGMTAIDQIYITANNLEGVPVGLFQDRTSLTIINTNLTVLPNGVLQDLTFLEKLYLSANSLDVLSADTFNGLPLLQGLVLVNNNIRVVQAELFQGLTELTLLAINGNMLTTLPDGLFDDLTSLGTLVISSSSASSSDIECLPTLPSNPNIVFDVPPGTCGCTLDNIADDEAIELLCGTEMTCESGTTGYTCESSAGGTGDPHMIGFSGQKFDFTGKDGSWYAVLKDGLAHVNMRVTAPLRDLDVITYITGISIIVPDLDGHMHTISVYVEYPHALDSGCPVGVSPCLANGALTILLDDVEVLSPGEVTLGRGVSFGAVNLPGECRPFGFEKYWERKVREAQETDAEHGRKLDENFGMSMAEWILSDQLTTNKPECEAYVNDAGDNLFAHQAEHVSFQLNTPSFTMRLNYGKLHQVAVRDPTDQFDLPDHLTHQMNIGLSHVTLGKFPEGILGETAAVRTDIYGVPIMTGVAVISGNEEDYKVKGALGLSFKQASN